MPGISSELNVHDELLQAAGMHGAETHYASHDSQKAFTISTIRMLQSLLSEAVAREAAISYPLGSHPFLPRYDRAASMQRMLVEGAIWVHGPEEQRVALPWLILQTIENRSMPVSRRTITSTQSQTIGIGCIGVGGRPMKLQRIASDHL